MWKYIDRKYKDTIVLVPGWATDYRIFDSLDLRFNYLVPVNFSPFDFEGSLLGALKQNNIEKVSLVGYSLGGFLAADFACRFPGLVDRLILISIRKRYKKEEISQIRKQVRKNKEARLYKFYTQCFSDNEQMSRFKKNLFKNYCRTMDLTSLLEGLDYLGNAEIKPESLNNVKRIKIIHGGYDTIAPIREAVDIKNGLPNAEFMFVKDAGHIPFFKEDFNKYI